MTSLVRWIHKKMIRAIGRRYGLLVPVVVVVVVWERGHITLIIKVERGVNWLTDQRTRLYV